MHIVIAPDSFKESLSAPHVAQAIQVGMASVLPNAQFSLLPMADGGEGFAQSFLERLGGERFHCEVTGPDFRPVTASFIINREHRIAVLDVASASGLPLIPLNERNPRHTTSLGTGELIRTALDHDIDEIIIGLGGSATNDAGAGILTALGAKLLDGTGNPILPTGEGLGALMTVDLGALDPRLNTVTLTAACDVDNPLCGPHGATTVFGPQKGAQEEDIRTLEQYLHRFASICHLQLGQSISHFSGAGAAGGIGAALGGLLGARLEPGVELLLSRTHAHHLLAEADWVITGEGRIDGQTQHGKVPAAIARIAHSYHTPVIVLAGSVGDDCESLYQQGIKAIFPIQAGPCALSDALMDSKKNLMRTSENIARMIQLAGHS
ncbi:glycerate kinase [Salinivibrio sp. ES.052]|uniref:glycerate kinase n=1 Tax=Salinivibrio sp. ES.052 TaxID=1882823 RepID=UPI000926A6C5|nr:glycerate kinase [Salinivibrio sp. ES.052]SIO05332.1 glycerate kinase [Salinivibrio sp. ES.052]